MAEIKKIIDAGESLLSSIRESMKMVDWELIIKFADMLPTAKKIFIVGAGRSGLVARSFGMRLMHAALPAYIPGETITPAAGKGDLLVAISCTGLTGYTSYLTKRAKELGAKVIVLSAEKESPLSTVADNLIIIPVNENDIVRKAAVFEHTTSLCLDALFNVLSERLKIDAEMFRSRHANLE